MDGLHWGGKVKLMENEGRWGNRTRREVEVFSRSVRSIAFLRLPREAVPSTSDPKQVSYVNILWIIYIGAP